MEHFLELVTSNPSQTVTQVQLCRQLVLYLPHDHSRLFFGTETATN